MSAPVEAWVRVNQKESDLRESVIDSDGHLREVAYKPFFWVGPEDEKY